MNNWSQHNKGKYVAIGIGLIFVFFLFDTMSRAYAQTQRKNEILKDENFNRPTPTRPIRPEIPNANRYQEDKIFLEYADSLYKLQNKYDTIERQIVKGNVKFRQSGMWLFCDSAYYFPEANSLDAFGNVRMEQGDTLFVYADKLFYNGNARMAYLQNGPSREKVTMINKDVTLNTDSLDYDLSIDLGWFSRWGTIDDKVNTLTSLYGEYSPKTKKAEFYTDVVLVNNRDGFTMLTDTLHYNTETHIADIDSKTEIQGANDTIYTTLATYYTDSGDADLLSRSLIIHKDSTGNVTTLEGDSIIFDNATRISRVYMFDSPSKRSYPMVLTDTAQKTTLIGGFGLYNDSTKEALATIYPLLMEYSQGDTLFLRADTIKTFMVTEMVASKKRKITTSSGYPESDGKPIVIVDSLGIWIDSVFFSVQAAMLDLPIKILNAAVKKEDKKTESKIEKNESIIAEDIVQPDLPEEDEIKPDTITDNIIEVNIAPLDSIGLMSDTISTDSIGTEKIVDKGDSIPYQYHIAVAYHRGRFFKQDMQGVADSLVFVEKDSLLYLFRKPIVWSGERQVTGNRIDVHFNDSTADWAYLPESGLISELVDEDFYNQISGKEIKAYFEGEGLRKLEVSGNVQTIFLPQESDSTFNRMVNAESSYLELYLKDNKMDMLKMWPEVSGTVTPLFQVKSTQKYLQNFKWWGFLRPEREWYGDRIRWADNLGEVPDELEQYFLTPSDFGDPKTFSGSRVIIPTSSLLEDSVNVKEVESLTVSEIEKSSEEEEMAEKEFGQEAQEIIKTEVNSTKEESIKIKTEDE